MIQAKSAAGREHQDDDVGAPSRFKYKLTGEISNSDPSSTE